MQIKEKSKKQLKKENKQKFDAYKNKSVDKISLEILNLLENQNLSESEKGEVVLKVLRKIMNFKDPKGEKLA